jgi:plastocyanin
LSRIVLGIGITLSVASVLSIYITSVASQNQLASSSSPSPSQVSTQPVASNISNSASANITSTTSITIPQGASTQQAGLNLKYFTPINASVPKDAAITWTNKDIAPHTATASDGSFDTGMINVGSTGSATVKGQGDIQYHCTIHPWMHGSLLVSS